jgi:2-(1,2-epoxy-1,2-dihydrophenyl)acetyl-CoA isomerase
MPEARLDVRDAVATITLVDPDGVNPLDADFVARLRGLVDTAADDPAAAVIVLRAQARAFCAGGDIDWFADRAATIPEEIVGLTDDVTAIIGTLHEGPKTTIAAVHGAVAGGGLGLALACDLVVAAQDTTFAIAYGRIGASPDLGVSTFLARDIGYRRALELCLLCERLTADEALDLGLVNRVVSRGDLDETTAGLAARIAAGPLDAHATAKRLLRDAVGAPLDSHLADELRSVAELSRGTDWAEGIAAFREGREAVFGGAGVPVPGRR